MALTVFTFVVMSLWNWLMPSLFGLRTITFVQTLGLLVLSQILLGGLRGRGPGRHARRRMMGRAMERMMDRWEQMTPEEREQSSNRFHSRGLRWDRWDKMTPEEREKFRGWARHACGFEERGWESPSSPEEK